MTNHATCLVVTQRNVMLVVIFAFSVTQVAILIVSDSLLLAVCFAVPSFWYRCAAVLCHVAKGL